MPMRLFTDSSANLSLAYTTAHDVHVLPLTLLLDGQELLCDDPVFDREAFYVRLRTDKTVELKTSMLNDGAFLDAFTPAVQAGDDVLYVAMSSGISGTVAAAERAAQTLRTQFPDRQIEVLDTMGASLGEGLVVMEAVALRDAGKSVLESKELLTQRRTQLHQHFLVDDLMFLKRGGRIRGSAALIASLINLKPIMTADEQGHIVVDRKVVSRRKALRTLATIFEEQYVPCAENVQAAIAHCGCEQDAKVLAETIRTQHPEVQFTFACYEPGTGAHVGPDTVALFFWGEPRKESEPVLPALRAKTAAEARSIKEGIASKLPGAKDKQ